MAPQEDSTDDSSFSYADFGDSIDINTFEQILEMDDDEDDREFSKSIVFGFFEQAESTFENMQTALTEKDLKQLSALGHFLKGSSATLGLAHIKDDCEKIQHHGAGKNATGEHDEDDETCLSNIKTILGDVQTEYEVVKGLLTRFYDN